MSQYIGIRTPQGQPMNYIGFLLLTHKFKMKCQESIGQACQLTVQFRDSSENIMSTAHDYGQTNAGIFNEASNITVLVRPLEALHTATVPYGMFVFKKGADNSNIEGYITSSDDNPIDLDFGHTLCNRTNAFTVGAPAAP